MQRGGRVYGLAFRVITQRLHVALWYILRAQNGSHITTLGPKYIPYNYMEPLGRVLGDLDGLLGSFSKKFLIP